MGSTPPGTFFDYGTLHLVTTATLTRLRSAYPAGDFDPRRFRPNLVIDTPGEPGFTEDAWIGVRLRIGEALLRPLAPPDVWSPPSATATSRPIRRSCVPSRASTAYPFSTSAGSPASAYTSTS
ncbi:MOSC domain-containing protein [Streptomyces ossamyceticus]|nr:MOSC domain-containing protein [Streptomyces ossamyceticus]